MVNIMAPFTHMDSTMFCMKTQDEDRDGKPVHYPSQAPRTPFQIRYNGGRDDGTAPSFDGDNRPAVGVEFLGTQRELNALMRLLADLKLGYFVSGLEADQRTIIDTLQDLGFIGVLSRACRIDAKYSQLIYYSRSMRYESAAGGGVPHISITGGFNSPDRLFVQPEWIVDLSTEQAVAEQAAISRRHTESRIQNLAAAVPVFSRKLGYLKNARAFTLARLQRHIESLEAQRG